jgi:hypothetical protein
LPNRNNTLPRALSGAPSLRSPHPACAGVPVFSFGPYVLILHDTFIGATPRRRIAKTRSRVPFRASPLRLEGVIGGIAEFPDRNNTLPRAVSGAPSLQPRFAGFPSAPLSRSFTIPSSGPRSAAGSPKHAPACRFGRPHSGTSRFWGVFQVSDTRPCSTVSGTEGPAPSATPHRHHSPIPPPHGVRRMPDTEGSRHPRAEPFLKTPIQRYGADRGPGPPEAFAGSQPHKQAHPKTSSPPQHRPVKPPA